MDHADMDDMQPRLQFTAFKEFGGVAGNEAWRSAISSTGAAYHSHDQRWHLQISLDPFPVDTINALFEIARQYGATVTAELHTQRDESS